MKKLVCDRCGQELTGKEDLEIALEGQEAWAGIVTAQGGQLRGILPCEHYIRCGGEMKLVKNGGIWRRRDSKKSLSQ